MSAQFKLLILLSYGKKEKMMILQEKLSSLPEREGNVALICSDNKKIIKSGKTLRKILRSFGSSSDLNEKKGPFDPDKIEKLFRKKDYRANVVLVVLTERDTVIKIARKYLYDYFAREDKEILSQLEPGQGLAIARNGITWSFPYPRQH